MYTETMIRQLQNEAEKHKNDKLLTFQTDITAMCNDIIPKLEQLKHYEDLVEKGLLVEISSEDYQDLLDYRKAEKILLEADRSRKIYYISENKTWQMQGNTVMLLIQRGIHKFYDTWPEAEQALKEMEK